MKPKESPAQTWSDHRSGGADRFPPSALRTRLLAVVALALSPLLALSAFQAFVEYREEEINRRDRLYSSAQRAADRVDSTIEGARPLLEALGTQEAVTAGGEECQQILRGALFGMREYNNLKRIEPTGVVSCSAIATEGVINETREGGDWLDDLRGGEPFAVSEVFFSLVSNTRVVLAGIPLFDDRGGFNGALALTINVETLDRYIDPGLLPPTSRAFLVDASGEAISRLNDSASQFSVPVAVLERAVAEPEGVLLTRTDWRPGQDVLIAPLVQDDFFIVLTTADPSIVSWASVNLVGMVLVPLLMWFIALGAVALGSERLMLQWLDYLGRIARIYGSGRLDVEPARAARAPDEIAELAGTMQDMAGRLRLREQELQQTADLNAALVREIHHRVKNNLQIIVSLFNLQISNADDAATISVLEEARGRVNALALVHRSLYESEGLQEIRLAPFFTELLNQLAIASGAARRDITVETFVDDVALPPDETVPLALFVTEGATNVFKHAFVGRSSGRLRLKVKRADGRVRVDIEDDGRGWPEDSDFDAASGVGSALIAGFARQLDAEIERGDSDLGGARLTLEFSATEQSKGTSSAEKRSDDGADDGGQP